MSQVQTLSGEFGAALHDSVTSCAYLRTAGSIPSLAMVGIYRIKFYPHRANDAALQVTVTSLLEPVV